MLDEIVLIDDDKTVNLVNRRILQKMIPSATIKIFENGEKGLVYLISAQDLNLRTLVFLDINMPIMDGFQFLSIYENAIAYQAHSFVICLLTSSTGKQNKRKAAEFPCVLEYAKKPLTPKKIEGLIERATSVLNERQGS